jgi:Relaxase/Mobilisation nuclease domain/Integrase core domain
MMEFAAANQTSRTKRCDKDVLHMSLSWHPDELPTREQMEKAAHEALKALGMENARALFVAHNDTDHVHLHIVASRINPETGRAFSDTNDWKKINEWALEYERQSGIIRYQKRETIDPHNPEKVLEALTADRSTFARSDFERLLGKAIVSRMERRELADAILARPEIIPLRESANDEFALRGRAKEAERALEEACLARFGTLRPHGPTPVVRSDNGLIFQSRRFRAACRDYRLRQEFITPYTPEQNGLVERFFRSLKEECVWQHNLASFAEARAAITQWIHCTTPNVFTRHSAIAARGSFARYNPNSWLELEGALHST